MEVTAEAGEGTNAWPSRSPSAGAALISGPNPSLSLSSSSNSDFCAVGVEVGTIDFSTGFPGRTGCCAGPANVSTNDLETSQMINEARLEDFEILYRSISVKAGTCARLGGPHERREDDIRLILLDLLPFLINSPWERVKRREGGGPC